MKTYKSKIGYTLIAITASCCLGLLVLLYIEKAPRIMYWVFSIFTLLMLSYIVYLNFNTSYTINNTKVIVKCGRLYTKEIDINTIKSIAKTSVLLSAPAPSYKRIELVYGKYETLVISPKNEKDFAKDLVKINSNITNKLE